jgi:hypothetical protein
MKIQRARRCQDRNSELILDTPSKVPIHVFNIQIETTVFLKNAIPLPFWKRRNYT